MVACSDCCSVYQPHSHTHTHRAACVWLGNVCTQLYSNFDAAITRHQTLCDTVLHFNTLCVTLYYNVCYAVLHCVLHCITLCDAVLPCRSIGLGRRRSMLSTQSRCAGTCTPCLKIWPGTGSQRSPVIHVQCTSLNQLCKSQKVLWHIC